MVQAEGSLDNADQATNYDGDLIKSTVDILNHKTPIIDPDELIGISFTAKAPTGHEERATVDRKVEQETNQEDRWIIKYLNGGEDILSYHQIINLINRSGEDGEPKWTYQAINGHKRDKKKKWLVKILWDTNEETWEPIENIKETDPITLDCQ